MRPCSARSRALFFFLGLAMLSLTSAGVAQGVSVDLAANPQGLVFSNGGGAMIGK